MAATESRKRKSLHFDHDEQTTTPTGSPVRKKLKLTRSQKQALINNLQLESMRLRALPFDIRLTLA